MQRMSRSSSVVSNSSSSTVTGLRPVWGPLPTKNFVEVDTRDEDWKLRLGIRRVGPYEIGVPDSIIAKHYQYPYILSSVADAICHKRMFHVFYSSRARYQEFVIPYWKYKESIVEPVLAGGKFILRPKMISVVVDSIADCDPYKWPNSKCRCLKVIGNKGDYKEAVSPSDIVCDVSSSIMTRTSSRSLQMQSPAAQQLEQQNQEVQSKQNLLPLWPPLNLVLPFTLFPDEDANLLLKVGPTLEYLEIDSSSSASLLKSKSATAAVNQLKISKLSDL
ncbi:hypothetical protein Q3G72_004203 [Acer saccharum]|nr:hypothetical protein Q3G72_004203 [Acer saccharum]